MGSTRVEFVTVAEDWIVVPAKVPAVTWKVMLRAVAAVPLASEAAGSGSAHDGTDGPSRGSGASPIRTGGRLVSHVGRGLHVDADRSSCGSSRAIVGDYVGVGHVLACGDHRGGSSLNQLEGSAPPAASTVMEVALVLFDGMGSGEGRIRHGGGIGDDGAGGGSGIHLYRDGQRVGGSPAGQGGVVGTDDDTSAVNGGMRAAGPAGAGKSLIGGVGRSLRGDGNRPSRRGGRAVVGRRFGVDVGSTRGDGGGRSGLRQLKIGGARGFDGDGACAGVIGRNRVGEGGISHCGGIFDDRAGGSAGNDQHGHGEGTGIGPAG